MAALVWIACARGDSDKPARPSSDSAPKARLRSVTGDVRLKRASGDDWVAASPKNPLLANDKLRTLHGASAVIEFTNGSIVHLGEDALIGIAETRPTPGRDPSDLTLLRGDVDAQLADPSNQSLSVNTPNATVRAGREIVFQ